MKTFVVKGNLCFSRSMDELVCMEHSYIVVEDGRATGIFRTLPERYAQLPVLDYEDRLVLPGMTDLHIHAPQFAFRGLGMDMELLEWLNTYTFPEESKYKELEYADRAYGSFVEHLLHSTTTRAAIFATIHVPATKLLMQKLDEAGLSCYVGKVNMNRNSPVYLREISTNQALRDTESWLCETKEAYRFFRMTAWRMKTAASNRSSSAAMRMIQNAGLWRSPVRWPPSGVLSSELSGSASSCSSS